MEANGIKPDRMVPVAVAPGSVEADAEVPSSLPSSTGGSLQDSIVEDTSIEPSRDPQLSAALRHLLTLERPGAVGLTYRNEPRLDR